MQLTEKFVQRQGAHIFTQALGEGSNGTVLLSMGATASMAWWPPNFIEALASAGYQVIWYDLRDTGRSTQSPVGAPAYDVPDLAKDAVAILDAYDVPAAHLVGMSLGGLITQIVALQHAARVRTITLFAAEPLGNAYDGEGMPAAMMDHFAGLATLDWTDRQAVTAFLLQIAELSSAPGRPFDREAALERIDRELNHTTSMQCAFNHTMLEGNIDPQLKAQNITQPTLVIHGEGDPLISVAAAKRTAQLVQNAELFVLANVGHEFTPLEVQPLAEAIIEFIGQATSEPVIRPI